MALNVGKSLYWRTSLDNSGLKSDAKEAALIVNNISDQISGTNLFAASEKSGEKILAFLKDAATFTREQIDEMLGAFNEKAANLSTAEIELEIKALTEIRKEFDAFSTEYQFITNRLFELTDALYDRYGLHRDDIATAIEEGFRDGLTSASDFAKKFQTLLSSAVITAFKNKVNDELVKGWYEKFTASMESGGGLDVGEVESLKTSWADIIEKARAYFTDLETATGLDLTDTENAKGISGAIAGVTEHTAGLLEGQFNAMRVNMLELLGEVQNTDFKGKLGVMLTQENEVYKLFQNELSILQKIEDNTRSTIEGPNIQNTYFSIKANVELSPIHGRLGEIMMNSYYMPDIYHKMDAILTAANRTADMSEKYLPYLPYLKRIADRIELNAITNNRATGG